MTQLLAHRHRLGETPSLDALAAVCAQFDDDAPLPDVVRARAILQTVGAA
jgi:hypothetical protein